MRFLQGLRSPRRASRGLTPPLSEVLVGCPRLGRVVLRRTCGQPLLSDQSAGRGGLEPRKALPSTNDLARIGDMTVAKPKTAARNYVTCGVCVPQLGDLAERRRNRTFQ